ncbi:unnamed protein product [Paramecium primaurelia]|uniref:Papain family cysteine protease n=1 Tax=Paramecium primaurelia TaxID=5886 RepID=A0A8S1LX83_PARPR|nr:unnamed protein product [Paramecium primaurelia]
MKNLYIVALLSISLLSLQLYNSEQQTDEYSKWKQHHQKLYQGVEDTYRKQIFHQNLQIVNEHNARYNQGLENFEIEANQFADLTFDEFSSLYLYSSYPDQEYINNSFQKTTQKQNKSIKADIPDHYDWSTIIQDYSQPYNQGKCLGSWAFAVAGSIESALYLGTYEQISPQYLINCVDQTNPCLEGSVKNTWDWVTDNQNYLDLEVNVAYTGTKGACIPSLDNIQLLNGYEMLNKDQFVQDSDYYQALSEHIVVSPLSVSSIYFQLYKTGVFDKPCGNNPNYDALVVGYDARTDQGSLPFYKLKMSWSPNYGEQGYVRIAMANKCIYEKQSYANKA